MDLEVLTNIVNDYDPVLLGFLAISTPTVIGIISYSCARQIYSNLRDRGSKKSNKQSLSIDNREPMDNCGYGGYI